MALIYQLVQAFCEPGDEVVYAWRSFEAYPIAATAAAATSVRVPVTADGRHDLDAMLAAITDRTRLVLVCTPNNPTGPAVTQAELDAFLAAVPPHVLVVVDEAYVEFVRMADAVDGVATYARHENVVLTRTFSKAYGLAGFRVGYAVAPAPIAGALRAVSLPFGVSHVAQAAAVASLAAEDALLERVDALVGERDRVLAGLREAGWDVPDAQGNFVWLGLGDRAADFAAAADAAGIVVRPFAGDGVRVSIGEPEGNDRLLEVARRLPRLQALHGVSAARSARSPAGGGRRGAAVHLAERRQHGGGHGGDEVRHPEDEQRRGQAEAGDEHPAEQPAEGHQREAHGGGQRADPPDQRARGMRSKNTAPRIGLRKPEAKPPTTKTVKTSQHRCVEGHHHEARQPGHQEGDQVGAEAGDALAPGGRDQGADDRTRRRTRRTSRRPAPRRSRCPTPTRARSRWPRPGRAGW